MELKRLLLVFTLCLISRTLAFETKKLSQPLQKDILNSVLKEPVRLPSETRIKHADEEEDEYDIKCGPLPTLHCGHFTGTSHDMGQTWHLQCDPGCHLVGSGELTCIGVPDPFHHVAIWDSFQGLSKCVKNPIDTKRSPPYLTSMGKETDFKGTETESEDSVCLQPKKQGPCKARMVRFFYDQTSKSCKEFIYGGCQRNDNNFKTQKECEEKCSN